MCIRFKKNPQPTPVRATAPSPAAAALPPTWAGGAATPTCPFPQPLGSPGGVPDGDQAPAVTPSPPWGIGTFPSGPSPTPEFPVAAATPPFHPLVHLARVTAPSLATVVLPLTRASGAATPNCPLPQPLGSPGGVSYGGEAPAVPTWPPWGNGTFFNWAFTCA